MEYPSMILSD